MDKYALNARVYPAFILLFPFFIIGIVYSIDIEKYYHIATSLGVVSVLSLFISNLVREMGKKKENKLWTDWGGAPTIQLFRSNNQRIDTITKQRAYKMLFELVPESKMTFDSKDENDRDEIYKAWTSYLISKTRNNKEYSLLFSENISYGFRRNLYSLKPIGLLICIVGCIGNYLFVAIPKGFSNFISYGLPFFISELLILVLLLIWIFLITSTWIRTQAFSYADRLFESIEKVHRCEVR
jgi:hypothetical protein